MGRSIRVSLYRLLVAACLLAAEPVRAAGNQIKLATLQPRGTSVHKILQEMGEQWRKSTGGGVQLTIYPDGIMGSEGAVVSRMRLGQL